MGERGSSTWDQSKFDATLKEYLLRSESSTWPRSLNKKGLFIALAAIPETPRVPFERMLAELNRPVPAKRMDPRSGHYVSVGGEVPIGIVIAVKRAARKYTGSRQFQAAARRELRGKTPGYRGAWLNLITQTFNKMVGGRKASAGFIRVGYISIIRKLGPLIGGRYDRSGGDSSSKLRGAFKGTASPALPGRLQVVMENTAQSRTEKRNGLVRFGEGPLQRAFDKETANMQQFLDEEMRADAEKFNAGQR